MKVSRRRLLQVLPAAAATPLQAQETPPTPADTELESARQYQRIAVQTVRRVELPMAAEPAMKFVPRN
jgi:hypothetical protein